MKDAWFTDVGHNRSGMAEGLPMGKARKAYRRIGKSIRNVMKR